VQKNGGSLRVKGRPVRNYILTLVKSSDDASTIRQKGGVIWQDFGGGICAAFLPIDSLGVLEQTPSILCMEANALEQVMNDTSSVIIGVDKAWNFENSLSSQPSTFNSFHPHAFTGKGVVAGVMDISFDFTHPAFRNDDGTSRIKWFWDPLAENEDPDALGVIYDSSEKVLAVEYSGDASTVEPHGTHIMGSMAGNGLNGRYVGMAPEADIMGATALLGTVPVDLMERFGDYVKNHLEDWTGLEDVITKVDISSVGNLVELKRIFDAADVAGKPCVVNWSFGMPFDFYSDYTLYEEVINQMLGPGHILLISAGNDGHRKTFVRKEADEPIKQELFFEGSEDVKEHEYYLTVRVDKDYDPYFTMKLEIEGSDQPILIDTREVLNVLEKPGYECSLKMPNFVCRISYQLPCDMYVFLLKIILDPDIYTDPQKMKGAFSVDTPIALEFKSYTIKDLLTFSPYGYKDSRGCNQHTMGYPASLERAITVGAMHHRSSFTNYLGESATYKPMGSEEGHLVSFSSCGPSASGKVKPDVVAPGHNIISPLSSFYRKNGSDEETKEEVEPLTAIKANVFGKEYAMWALSGTSMANPITSGVIALWLQAKPNLTPEDIKGVIERTSHQPEPEFSGTKKNIYYGWGEIDAYAGLLDILGLGSSIPELSNHQPASVKFRLQGHTLYIDGAEDGTPIRIYTTDGRQVTSTLLSGGSVSLPTDSPVGVYAVQVGKLGSTLIRL
jgi:subtilisin family serine protease